ncbi:MAG: PfkB family carbohydrate kinase, partial [Spirochaetaceae bacterium]|nr:PfkB family carbohydrate kinase [Spirochaetaceae bacterium]
MATRADCVVLSHVIVDDLHFASGGERRGVLGGAGTYAAAGVRLAGGGAGIACGVGEDFAGSAHAAWFDGNGIDTAGLEPRGRRTPRSTVVYHREDARTETPAYGEEHFTRMRPRIDRLPASYRAARGYYIFRDHDAAFWHEAAALRAATGAVVLWELHAAAAVAARWPAVAARLARVDLVSLNLAEGRRLCSTREARTPEARVRAARMPLGVPASSAGQRLAGQRPAGRRPAGPPSRLRRPPGTAPEPRMGEAQEIAARLLATGVGAVALRLGAHGALLARPPAEYRHIPAWPTTVVDSTGAGNAFGGALLAAVAAGDDWLSAACGASAAASLMLAQHGPPPRLDARRRDWLRRRDLLLAG